MRPWWERNPAALDADIEQLTRAGFRVRRRMSASGLLELVIERGTQQFLVMYLRGTAHDFIGGSRFLVMEAVATRATRWVFGSQPLEAVQLIMSGNAALFLADDPERQRVIVPYEWDRVIDGGGRLELGRSPFDSRVHAVRVLNGSTSQLGLQEAAAPFERAFSVRVPGLWVAGRHADATAAMPEDIVRSAERQLAAFHGLSVVAVRARLRTEIGAIVDGRSYPRWQFVRRGPGREPIVLGTERVDSRAWKQRAPYANRIAGRRVTVIGCGAVGWSVATQLARSGVTDFTLYDADRLSLGNLARVGAFLNAVGRPKVEVLAEQLEATVPGVRAVPIGLDVGVEVGPRSLVADAPDLLINLTGETTSTDDTNLAALALEKPAIFAWVSEGVAAGRIFRLRPYQSACYHCVREAGLVPIPSHGLVPTDPELAWSGASFNVDAFATAVARLAVLTLAGEPVSLANPDHVILGFGTATPWEQQIKVPRDPRCAICGTGRPSDFLEWRP